MDIEIIIQQAIEEILSEEEGSELLSSHYEMYDEKTILLNCQVKINENTMTHYKYIPIN
jgi:hypothetical protein